MRTIHILLHKGNMRPVGASHQQIQNSCKIAVCDAHKGEAILQTLERQLEWCCQNIYNDLISKDPTGVASLEPFVELCQWYEQQITLLATLLAPLDGLYLREDCKQDIKTRAYSALHKHLYSKGMVVKRIQSGVLDWASWERENRQVHGARPLVHTLVAELQRHGLYGSLVESFYLRTTHQVYLAEGTKARQTLEPPAFLRKCDELVESEVERARAVLPSTSVLPVTIAAEKAFLVPHVDWMVSPVLRALMPNPESAPLRGVYKVFSMTGCLPVLAAALCRYIRIFIHGVLTDTRPDEQRIDAVLIQYRSYMFVLANAFYDEVSKDGGPAEPVQNQDLKRAIQDGIREGLHERQDFFAELLAKSLHKRLLRGPKGRPTHEYHKELEGVLMLHQFAERKDVFKVFFIRALAKRLVLGKTDLLHEEFVIDMLITHYDNDFNTGRKMLRDVNHTHELMLEFREKHLGHPTLTVWSLEQEVWPFAVRECPVALPSWMARELRKYERFYREKYRRGDSCLVLCWDHAIGYATLTAYFDRGTKELSVDLLQAVVLLLFNDGAELSFAHIAEKTEIEHERLCDALRSLACGKKRVLLKRPGGPDVCATDVFAFNAAFTDPEPRVHIQPVPRAAPARAAIAPVPRPLERRPAADARNEQSYALECAIMRVMKAQRRLARAQLHEAAVGALPRRFRFPQPDAAAVDELIASLVAREFLIKEDDVGVIRYNP
ncbi:cullin [Phanerochaete sordida]|uniref:Cullin n=1 Tax=Phanerochaete sordida TaxID=48140 RepID=A0A9P3GC29_9APHY|nr:cullin [Phanerochaete sordida]